MKEEPSNEKMGSKEGIALNRRYCKSAGIPLVDEWQR
jgi:hypothetical protein